MSDVFAYTIAAFALLAIAGMAAFVLTINHLVHKMDEPTENDDAQ